MSKIQVVTSINHEEVEFLCEPQKTLLNRHSDPDETTIRYWLAGNLCRCTGYDKIIRAVQDVARDRARDRARDLADPRRPKPTT